MDDDQTPLLVGIITLTLALGGIFILARVLTRTLIKPAFGLDDVLIIITWVRTFLVRHRTSENPLGDNLTVSKFINLGYEIAMFVSIRHGYGKHLNTLSASEASAAQQAEVVGQFMAISAFPTGKAAIAYLLIRIFPGKTFKRILWTFVAANAVFFYIDALIIILQCQPVAFQWDRTVTGGSCWSPNVVVDWGYLTGITGALTDLVFALIPWFHIVRLNMSLRQRLTIGIALSAGLFPFACAILKIYYTSTLGAHADFTYDTVPLVLWSSAELCAINIAACIPTLRPLAHWVLGKSLKTSEPRPSAYVLPTNIRNNTLRRLHPFSHRIGGADQLQSIDSRSN